MGLENTAAPADEGSERTRAVRTASTTWLGHATVLLDIDGACLLTDPVLGRWVGPLVRIAPPIESGALARVDCVLLSHLHGDHTDLRSLRRIARTSRVIAPRGAGRWLRRHGLREVQELRRGEETMVGPLRVLATAAEHDRHRRPLGPAAEPIGFVVRGSRSVYFAGDTDLFEEMSSLGCSIDVALLPVAGWGSTLGPGHLDPRRAAQAAARIAPRVAIPIHWGTLAPPRPFRRSSEPRRPAEEFAALAARLAPEVEVRVLSPGQRTEL